MATVNDLIATYQPQVEYFDPTPLLEFFASVGVRTLTLNQDTIRAINRYNAEIKASVDAVSIPYTGTTDAEFTTWTNQRLAAIDARLSTISDMAKAVQQQAQDTKEQYGKDIKVAATITWLASITPYTQPIGIMAGLITKSTENQAMAASMASDKSAALLVSEAQQLMQIRQSLTDLVAQKTELARLQDATTPGQWVYWVSGSVTLFFILAGGWLYLKHRRSKSPA